MGLIWAIKLCALCLAESLLESPRADKRRKFRYKISKTNG
jgi:hypothetical protein